MDLQKIISELAAEKQRLDEAIKALERLSAGKIHRRGRPPRWLSEQQAIPKEHGASETDVPSTPEPKNDKK